MDIKLYKDADNNLFNYPVDGSQDHLIGNKRAVTAAEAEAIVVNKLKKQGIKPLYPYVVQRAKAYPSLEDFADAWVKDDKVALEQYRRACLAVKAKYPKPKGF